MPRDRLRLVLATWNAGKARELRGLLSDLPVHISCLRQHDAPAAPRESGRSFAENASIKARYYARKMGVHVFSEDSGLCVASLGGLPGVRSARFLGSAATDADRCQRILLAMRGISTARARRAWFEVAGAIAEPRGTIPFLATCRCPGWIWREPVGRNGFGYDPIFYYPPAGRTFAEMSAVDKNAVSHRWRLAKKLRRFLTRYLRSIGRPTS